jgi:hypothetical protein
MDVTPVAFWKTIPQVCSGLSPGSQLGHTAGSLIKALDLTGKNDKQFIQELTMQRSLCPIVLHRRILRKESEFDNYTLRMMSWFVLY